VSTRALVALSVGQCVNWGILYYAFAALLLPIRRDLEAESWMVTGAYSLALLMSAACAPLVGRLSDHGHARTALQVGGYAGALLLGVWSLVPSQLSLYMVWALLGPCMACTLYEPAFVLVGQSYPEPAARLRALGVVTVWGGLASTVFLPLTGSLVAHYDWRATVAILAGVLFFSTASTHVLTSSPATPSGRAREQVAAPTPVATHFPFVPVVFAVASLGSAALMSNLIPALAERSVAPQHAAFFGGLLGIMQIPGRAWLTRSRSVTPTRLIFVSLLLQAGGMVALATTPMASGLALGIGVFAIGSGLMTVARPHFVHSIFGGDRAGALNGRLARAQQLARAVGPVAATWAASWSSYRIVFTVLGGGFLLVSLAWVSYARRWT
jgi:MFS family permease